MSSLDPERVEEFRLEEHGVRLMQLSFGMRLFFKGPFSDVREGVGELWRRYLNLVGKDTLTWARLGGGNRSRKVDTSVFKTIEAWLGGTKHYGDDCWISVHNGPMDGIESHSFRVTGRDRQLDWEQEASYVELNLPLDFPATADPVALARTLIHLAEPTAFHDGVAGFAFHRSPYEFNATVKRMGQLGMRYQGVEIAAAQRLAYLAVHGLPTVNWITFLGKELLQRVGGPEALAAMLPPTSAITSLPHGVAVQSGAQPVLGDRNESDDGLQALRKTYGVLRPLQFVDSEIPFSGLSFNSAQTQKWLTRLGAPHA
jgi:hypothetical protein